MIDFLTQENLFPQTGAVKTENQTDYQTPLILR